MIRRLATVIGLGMAVGAVYLWPVGGASAQTLEKALAAAYSTNPALLSQRATVRAADEEVPQALSNWRPSVELEGDYGTSEVKNYASAGTSSRDPRSLSLSLSQPLYRGGRTLAATRLAENSVLAERARLHTVEQGVLLQAATAYLDVVRDQAVLRLNVNNEQVLLRQLQATRDRFEVGEVTRTDVSQAEARLARATADRIQAEGDLQAGRATYLKVMGNAPGELQRPPPPVDLPASSAEAVLIAAKENPGVVSAQYDGLASRDNVDEIRGELLPTLDLTGSATKAYDTAGENSRIGTYEASVTLTIPLYQSGSVYSRLRQARQQAAALRLDVSQERRDAIEEATRAWEGLQTARARIQAFLTQLRASVVALEGVEREASVGSRTVLDILDAEQEKLDAEVSLALAQRDEMVAIFELKSALGQLTARRMNLPVDLYDPTGHYREVRWQWFGGGNSGADVDVAE